MLRNNLERVKAKIQEACKKVGRDPDEVTLVCVTKGIDVERIKEVISLGVADIGENRVQEAREKYNKLQITNYKLPNLKWHMVGHLQRNKARDAVRIFDLIHSVDSSRLAQAIDKEAAKIGKTQDILIEVNISGEKTKFGIEPERTFSLVQEVIKLENLRLKGLMTIAPIVDSPEKARTYFRMLRELRDEINQLLTLNPVRSFLLTGDLETSNGVNCRLLTLSMGMSQDFEVAIEEGATMVRLGTAIFHPITSTRSGFVYLKRLAVNGTR